MSGIEKLKKWGLRRRRPRFRPRFANALLARTHKMDVFTIIIYYLTSAIPLLFFYFRMSYCGYARSVVQRHLSEGGDALASLSPPRPPPRFYYVVRIVLTAHLLFGV